MLDLYTELESHDGKSLVAYRRGDYKVLSTHQQLRRGGVGGGGEEAVMKITFTLFYQLYQLLSLMAIFEFTGDIFVIIVFR